MSLKIDISASDLEWIRPAVLILSALISTWVLASARKRFSLLVAFLWALASLLFTLIVLPIYLFVLLTRRGAVQRQTRWRLALPLAYVLVLIGGITIYLYHERHGADSHLAQAAYAKLRGKRERAIAEYRAALIEEDNPHTRELLGVELFEAGHWTEALAELRRAENEGEGDSLSILRIAGVLQAINLPNQATLEYQRFLESPLCLEAAPDSHCEAARNLLEKGLKDR